MFLHLQLEKEKAEKLGKKDDKKKAAEELNVLFRPVEQKVTKGEYHFNLFDWLLLGDISATQCFSCLTNVG